MRYGIKTGRFGQYFKDLRDGVDLDLNQVADILNESKQYVFVNAWENFADETYKTHKEKGFTERELNDGEQIALMHSELSEALEGLRKDLMDDKLPKRPMVEAELADVVIRIMNYARQKGLDVSGAIVDKAEFNKTRPHKHGGKKF